MTIQLVPRSKHTISVIKTGQLKFAACSEIRRRHTNTVGLADGGSSER
jgi:hypothetical protein